MVLAVASSLSAQVFRESGAMFAPPDRQSLGILDTSRELLDQGRYSEAVQLLVTILDAQDDYFFIAANQADEPNAGRQYQSLKNEARSILSGMPPAAQQAYELRFGAAARQLLDDALAEGDFEQALEVQRRYFGSAAGYEAMYLSGLLCAESRPVLDGDTTLPNTPVQQCGGAVRTGAVAEAGDLLAVGGRADSSAGSAGRVAEAISPGPICRRRTIRGTVSALGGRARLAAEHRRRASGGEWVAERRGPCFATIWLVKVAAVAGPTCSRNRSGDRRPPTVSNWRWHCRLSGMNSFDVRK
jgi:hypothetical protein